MHSHMGDKRQEGEWYDVPRSGRGVFGASRPPSPETTACTTEAVRPLAQAVTNIDCGHHGPFSSFRFFYAEMLKKAGEGGGEVIKLDIGKEHPMQKYEKLWCAGIGCRASCSCSLRP